MTVRRRWRSRSSSRMNSRGARAAVRTPRFLSLEGRVPRRHDWRGEPRVTSICFTKRIAGLLFKTDTVPAPYCYRCPYNRAKPRTRRRAGVSQMQLGMRCQSRADDSARRSRKEILRRVRGRAVDARRGGNDCAAGRMAASASARLRGVDGALLIADEVMTGFGRTGVRRAAHRSSPVTSRDRAARPDRAGQGNDRRVPAHGRDTRRRNGSSTRSWATTRSSRRFSTATATPGTNSAPPRPSPVSTCLQSPKSIRERDRACRMR